MHHCKLYTPPPPFQFLSLIPFRYQTFYFWNLLKTVKKGFRHSFKLCLWLISHAFPFPIVTFLLHFKQGISLQSWNVYLTLRLLLKGWVPPRSSYLSLISRQFKFTDSTPTLSKGFCDQGIWQINPINDYRCTNVDWKGSTARLAIKRSAG